MTTSSCLCEIRESLRRLEQSGFTDCEHAVGLLIDYGEFETAATDALSTDANLSHPVVTVLRTTGLLAGHALCRAWSEDAEGTRLWAIRLSQALDRIAALPLPNSLQIRVSEGYAYYALYPQAYMEAARWFFKDAKPRQVACIGIRSIGTSLSAVVSATLQECGCRVHSYTVRCKGHPFDRRLVLDVKLEEQFRTMADRHFLIVDEGPGLSGSSFCGVTQKLVDLGIAEHRIIFFPNHNTDGSGFVSESARHRWPRHKKYVVAFDDIWINSGRLARALPCGDLRDISGGQWRSLLYKDESDYPPVQPFHERRKYLCQVPGSRPLMLKFAGLGCYGRPAHARAKTLADASFHPPVLGLTNGFLITEFVPGSPMGIKDIDRPFLNEAARYLAVLKRTPSTAAPAPHQEIMEMIAVNVEEGLGTDWAKKLARRNLKIPDDNGPAGSIDGRMLLHEWLRTPTGYLKTDSTDHADDHFSPGCQDTAWDLAACIIEWRLDGKMQNHLIDRYHSLTADGTIHARLPFYTIAYLAHRLGYTTLAAQTLDPITPDARRFQSLLPFYTSRLQQQISRL